MRMSLEKMVIENFKGTRKLTIDFSEETHIFGMNGTGKTTIPDAFSWVLFNKDSSGNAPGSDNFREKPLDAEGHEIHNLDTTVELVCKLDGQRLDLKRTQRENWVKKRGSTNPTFQGNVSTYWINDVETKLSDFKARIAEIAPEEIFRLIGTLAAFNAQDWKKRREQLIALTGGDVDSQLLARDKYRPIADECGQRNVGIEDLKKILMDQRKRTGNELSMIPIRIDEAKKALPEFKKDEIETAEYMLKDTAKDIERLDNLIAVAKANSGRAKHTAEIAAMENELATIIRQITSNWTEGRQILEKQKAEAEADMKRAKDRDGEEKTRLELLKKRRDSIQQQTSDLRIKYEAIRDEEFVWVDGVRTCPTCGQEIPEAMVAQKKAEALDAFKAEKVEKLKTITETGLHNKAELKQLEETINTLIADNTQTEAKMLETAARIAELQKQIQDFATAPDYDGNLRVTELRKQIAELKEQDSRVAPEDTTGYESQRARLLEKQEEKRAILARRDAGKETEKRIEALEEEHQKVGAQLAELERLIALVEKFITERCAALEEGINAFFPTVRWKLFETQINGGIADVCNCMIPCESGLVAYNSANTAAQVNADVEIINVLSKHYGVYIPLFIDGAESVNKIAHTDSQLITLSVSTDSELKVKEVA